MEENPSLNNIPELNKEFLAQNPDIGGVLNPSAFHALQMPIPKINPAQIAPVPKYHMPSTSTPGDDSAEKKPEDRFSSAMDKLRKVHSYAGDPYKYGSASAYDADYTGVFYDRYASMPSVYNKLGFSPWRDNENLYNTNSSWLNNFSRSFRSSMSLAMMSGKAMLPWNVFDETSIEDADNQERIFAKGMDTRGGFGSFVNNQVLNSGFTVGILGEIAAEQATIWAAGALLAPVTEGMSLGGSAMVSAEELASAGSKLGKIVDIGKMANRFKTLYDKTKSLEWARDFYNYAKTGGPLKNIASNLTPHIVDYYKESRALAAAGTNVSSLANFSRGVGAFYKDMRMVNAAVSESKMESGMVEQDLRKQLRDQFYTANGKMPTSDDYAQLYAKAKAAGDATFWWNLPAIYFSNLIVLDKAFNSSRLMKGMRPSLTSGFRKYALEEVEKGVWQPVKTGIRQDMKKLFQATTWNPKNLSKNFLRGAIKYTGANIAEGLQEQYQEAVSDAMKNYYGDQYFRPEIANIRGSLSYFGEGLGKQFTTAQGWETFASGFLMGGLVQGPQHLAFMKVPEMVQKIKNKEKYERANEEDLRRATQAANALNDIAKYANKSTSALDENANLQMNNKDSLEEAVNNGDSKGTIDIIDDSIANHLFTLAESDRMDIIKDHINDLLRMSPEEMVQAYGKVGKDNNESATMHADKLRGLLDKIEHVEKSYKDISKAFENPFDPSKYDPEKDAAKYNEELANYAAHRSAIKAAVLSRYHFDRSVERLSDLYQNAADNKPLDKASAHDFQLLYGDDENISNEITNLTKEISLHSELNTPEDRSAIKEKTKRLEVLQNFLDAKHDFLTAEEDHRNADWMTDEEVANSIKKSNVNVGSVVDYKKKDGTIKRVTVKRSRGNYFWDENGVRYSKDNISTFKKGEGFGTINDVVEQKANDLYDAYTAYTKHLAEKKKDVVFENKTEESFRNLLDYLRLTKDKGDLSDVINFLYNPENVKLFIERNKKAQQMAEDIRIRKSAEALHDFSQKMKDNKLFSDILDQGAFLDEKNADMLMRTGKVETIYSATSPYNPIAPSSDKYPIIMGIIDKWRKEKGFVEITPENKETTAQESSENPTAQATEKEPTIPESTPEEGTISRQDRSLLTDLGYSNKDIDEMGQQTADYLIENNITKKKRTEIEEKRLEREKQAALDKMEAEQVVMMEGFKKRLSEDVNSQEQLEEFRADLYDWMEENPTLDFSDIDAMMEEKKKSFTTLNFKGLTVGQLVLFDRPDAKGNKLRKIEKINKDSVEIRTLGLANEEVETIPADQVPSKLKKFEQKMKTKEEPVSDNAKEVAKKNLETSTTMDKTRKKELLENAKNKSADSINDDFMNSIGCE